MKNGFHEFYDKSKCSGCNGCVQICPNGCLATEIDKEGFNYPVAVKDEECIHCGKCKDVCPMEKNNFVNSKKIFIGAVNKNKNALQFKMNKIVK